MTNKLQELIQSSNQQNFATAAGRDVHRQMQKIFFDANGNANFNNNLVDKIKSIPELVKIMGPMSKTEVPIAGVVNGRFISRRIDRLYINQNTKTIIILDYKTDIDKNVFREKYIDKLTEYRELLKQIYNGFSVSCKIFWTNDFTLENVI